MALFLSVRLPGLGRTDAVPLEKLAFERVEFRDDEIVLHVVNDGPEPVIVSQVLVNDAYRAFTVTPQAPLAREKSRLRYLALLGTIAGAPAVAGAWLGGLAFGPVWAVLFLSIGAGAIFQVFVEILLAMGKGNVRGLLTPRNVIGFLAGLAVIYATGLLVAL